MSKYFQILTMWDLEILEKTVLLYTPGVSL